jgi:tRNA/rRNA methyltransferase
MLKPVLTPKEAARRMREQIAGGGKVGVMFGAEKAGLDSDDVARADAIVAVPLNPAFSSLNLAQAVLLLAYEWFLAGAEPAPETLPMAATRPANREELDGFFGHLEAELDAAGFLYPPEKTPRMKRNLRNLFLRADLTEQEVRTLRGVIAGLARRKTGD